ncbi:hypothetical protein AAFF_G00121540 [Aldrovandia affinis]|uniref:Uncharacterized protein n=1 Tax=Aldrovandia affinis TaxID=143900 RepID=A0AAD7RRZ5_9TELE|nr:hypothetical protein AAFF_G00121540 [Aldrovandia affinis]
MGYVQDFATIARPLHRLTDCGQPYVWDDPCAQAFNILQTALITAPEAQAQLAPTVATLRTIDGEAGCLLLSPVQVQEEQERDAVLTQVRSWLAAGKWPEWAVVGPWPRG